MRYEVLVEAQFAVLRRLVLVEADSPDEAKQIAEHDVDNELCEKDFGDTHLVIVEAVSVKPEEARS